MERRFDTLVFPGGKTRAFTLSYDDCVVQDRRLAELFRQYALKCTFNLNSALLGRKETRQDPGKKELDVSKIDQQEVETVYHTHEIGGHGLYHSFLDTIGTPLAMYDLIEDKRRLEALSGRPLKMFAYPYGRYNQQVVELLRLAGYQGARTVHSTHCFDIPENFLIWDPTCHHADHQLMPLAEEFVSGADEKPRLFYVWGHAYELDGEDNWDVMEKLCQFMAEHQDKVWFASNGEIIDYVNAYRRLEYSADGSLVYNPSALDVTIRTLTDYVTLPGGQVTNISD